MAGLGLGERERNHEEAAAPLVARGSRTAANPTPDQRGSAKALLTAAGGNMTFYWTDPFSHDRASRVQVRPGRDSGRTGYRFLRCLFSKRFSLPGNPFTVPSFNERDTPIPQYSIARCNSPSLSQNRQIILCTLASSRNCSIIARKILSISTVKSFRLYEHEE